MSVLDKKDISIIFPCYNGEKYLRRNLSSIKSSSYSKSIELIIIDNNSIDNSNNIICSFKNKLKIKLIKMNQNLGFAKACNLGVKRASSEFIFITNQDVIFTESFFQKLLAIYYKYKSNQEIIISPAVVFEHNGIHYFGAKNHILGFSYTPEIGNSLPQHKIIKKTNRFSGGSVFMKRSLFLEMGGFFENFFMYYEDSDLSLRILRKRLDIYTTNEPFLIHQKHEWKFNDFQYFLLERNRYLLIVRNIENLKLLLPFLLILEFILLFNAILMRKFNIKIRIYYQILSAFNYLKKLRHESRRQMPLLPLEIFSTKLDPILLGSFKNNPLFKKSLNLFNRILEMIL